MQKGVDWKVRRKEIDKEQKTNTKEKRPKTKEKEPPQAPPEEGMWEDTVGWERRGCAWRDIECYVFGRWKGEELKLKVHGLILKGQMFRGQKYALSHADRLSVNS